MGGVKEGEGRGRGRGRGRGERERGEEGVEGGRERVRKRKIEQMHNFLHSVGELVYTSCFYQRTCIFSLV